MGLLSTVKNSKTIINDLARDSDLFVEMTPEKRKKMQDTLLSIYDDVKAACDRHGLQVFLCGGSALGAVRHHGFIPWDDDMDLCMTRWDYEKFKEIFEKELGDKYVLNAPNYSPHPKNRFPRIMRKNTYFRRIVDDSREDLHLIFVDVVLLDNVPDSRLVRWFKGYYYIFFSLVAWEVFTWENRNATMKAFFLAGGKANYYLRAAVGCLFSFRTSIQWFNYCDRIARHSSTRSRDLTIPAGRRRYFGEILRRDQYLPGAKGEFEGREAWLFQDTDGYLRHLYGDDYMVIPPEGKRERHLICALKFLDETEGEAPKSARSAPAGSGAGRE